MYFWWECLIHTGIVFLEVDLKLTVLIGIFSKRFANLTWPEMDVFQDPNSPGVFRFERKMVAVLSLSRAKLFATPWTVAAQASLLPLSPCSNSCPLSQWCYLAISSSVVPFSFCFQSLPASGSFPKSQLFTSGGQSIEASASVLSVNIQGWFPLRLIGLISL